MKRIRASSLPRIMACPASITPPDVVMNSSGGVADIGTAVHEVLSDIIKTGADSAPELAPYIKKYDLDDADEKDLRFLVWRGLSIWNTFKTQIDPETISCETELTAGISDDWTLSGHVDVHGKLSGRHTFVIVDWKAGYVERQYTPQLLGYAYLLFHNVSPWMAGGSIAPLSFKIVTAWLRAGSWDVLDVTESDVDDFRNRLFEILESPDKTYSPDDSNCLYCPRSSECPAKTQMVRSAADSFYPLQEKSSAALTPREQLAAVYDQSLLLKRALDNYRDALKTTIAVDGPLLLTDGRILSLETEERETVLFGPETIKIVAPYLAVEKSDVGSVVDAIGHDAVSISKTRLLDAVSKHAPRGQKAVAKREALAALADAGCIKKTSYETIKAVKSLS